MRNEIRDLDWFSDWTKKRDRGQKSNFSVYGSVRIVERRTERDTNAAEQRFTLDIQELVEHLHEKAFEDPYTNMHK